jgi:cobalt-zinc-cadmium efflux system protein
LEHHHHSHPVSGKNLFLTILLNVIITITQLIGGILSGSLALLSDAVHNFSDVLSLVVSYVANWLTRKRKQTLTQTFGYKRAEIVAAFFNAATLIIIAVFLIIEAIGRFSHPQEISGNIVILLALLGIVANGLGVFFLQKDASHNLNMQSAYLHLLTDMFTSVAVLVGGLLMKYFGLFWIDPVLTILISLYLIYMSWRIFIESLKILMLFAPDELVMQDIEKAVVEIEGIKNIHHVHIWQLNDHEIHFEAHIEFEADILLSVFDQKCEQIEKLLHERFAIHHTNLQPEFKRDDEKAFIIQD